MDSGIGRRFLELLVREDYLSQELINQLLARTKGDHEEAMRLLLYSEIVPKSNIEAVRALLERVKKEVAIEKARAAPPPPPPPPSPPPQPPEPVPTKSTRPILAGVAVLLAIGTALYFLLPGKEEPPPSNPPDVSALLEKDREQNRARIRKDAEAKELAEAWEEAAKLWDVLIELGDPTASARAEEARRRAKPPATPPTPPPTPPPSRPADLQSLSKDERLLADLNREIARIESELWTDPREGETGWKESRRRYEKPLEEAKRRRRALEVQILSGYADALRSSSNDAEVPRRLTDFLKSGWREAVDAADRDRETFFLDAARREVRERDLHDLDRWLKAGGTLALDTNPSEADVYLFRYEEGTDWRRMPRPFHQLRGESRPPRSETSADGTAALECSAFNLVGRCPLPKTDLPAGSYLLLLRREGRREVRLPLLVEREGSYSATVNLYAEEEIGADYVYIPAGRFVSGGDQEAPCSSYPNRAEVSDFFISRFEVTVGEYAKFLEHVRRTKGVHAALNHAPRNRPDGDYVWRIPVTADEVTIPEGWDPKWPVRLISELDASAYCHWLTESSLTGGRQISYTLPNPTEWEKAARGMDGRLFPWGDRFDWPLAFGALSRPGDPAPAPVGAFPTDESPYGVRDLCGSVSEWCGATKDRFSLLKGGAFLLAEPAHFRPATRILRNDADLLPHAGFRIVKDPPRR